MIDVESTQDLPQQLEDVLRTWAHAQSPETDFAPWRMAAFNQPARLRNGQFFHPGELVLCRPAREHTEIDPRLGPLALWSFTARNELLVPAGLITLQTDPFGTEEIAPAVPHAEASQPVSNVAA
jgi:hypothetical protein